MSDKTMVNVSFSKEVLAQIDRLRAQPGRPEVKRAAWVAWAAAQYIASQAHQEPPPRPRKVIARQPPKDPLATPAAEAALHEGARLRAARETAKLTVPQLAEQLSVSRGQVQRAERAGSLEQWPALRAWLLEQEAKP